MTRRAKYILVICLIVISLVIAIVCWLEISGRIDIVADYYAPQYIYDLDDGDALSAEDINQYLRSKNPNINKNAGYKLAHWCRKLNVNPAFVLGIAEADSSNGLAGVGRSNKNPGNTKISYQRLDQLGIGHASYRGGNNFAVFNSWADGYSAIAVTLANYSYYNLNSQIDPILRTYAGHPNPNYYQTVKGTMADLLSKIDIVIKVKPANPEDKVDQLTVILRRAGKKINQKKVGKKREIEFSNLPRSRYKVIVKNEDYRSRRRVISSPQKTTKLSFELMSKDRTYVSGKVRNLVMSTTDNEGIVVRISGEDGEVVKRATTANDGFYYFGNLISGNYVVSIDPVVDLPTGFYYSKEVDLSKNPKTGVDFIY